MCCYLNEVRDVKMAAGMFSRFFLEYGMQPSSRLLNFVNTRRQRDSVVESMGMSPLRARLP